MVHKDISAGGSDAAELIVEALRTLRARYEQAAEQHDSAKAQRCAQEGLAFALLLIDNLVGWAVEEVIRGDARNPKISPRKEKRRRNAKPGERTADRVLIARMIALGGIVPPTYRSELQLALKALNEGEVRPLLRPSLTGRWQFLSDGLAIAIMEWSDGQKQVATADDAAEPRNRVVDVTVVKQSP